MNLSNTNKGVNRRFLTALLLVSFAVLTVGLAGSFVLLSEIETQLRMNQTQAAAREAKVIARFVARDIDGGASPEKTISGLQNVLTGMGSHAEFLCMLDEDGRVISHPDASKIGMPWGDMDMVRLGTEQPVPIASVLHSRQAVAGMQGEPDEPMQLVYYQPVQGEPWTIAVHKNTAVIASEFAALRWKLLLVVVPTLLLISIVGVGLARSLGKRYEQALAAENATLERRVQERTSELSAALAELQIAHERLLQGEKMHLLGELMAGIAHEINNPLTAIGGYAEMLKLGIKKDARETGSVILKQSQRVAAIVRNLLNFARNRPAQRTPGSLVDVLHNAKELIAAELRQSNIQLESSVSSDLPQVLMDAQQMEQVFINLVRNASQALAGQAGKKTITVRAVTDGFWVAVLIRDNGPGIPEELRAKVFDSFVTTKDEGTGLGLSLCKRFVESHGGQMELLPSQDRPGACFQIRIPVYEAKTAHN